MKRKKNKFINKKMERGGVFGWGGGKKKGGGGGGGEGLKIIFLALGHM